MRLRQDKLRLAVAVMTTMLLVCSAALFAAPAATEAASAPAANDHVMGHAPMVNGAAATGEAAKGEAPENASQRELVAWVETLVATICIFVGLVVVLRLTAWKPIMAGLKGREDAIRNSIEAAQKARAEAERTTKDLEAKMAEVQRQAAAQLTQAKTDAVKIADSIRAQAEAESASLKDRTLREIDAAKQQALGEINNHAAILGTAVASKILKRQVTADDQQRLVEETLGELAKKN